MSLVDDVTHLAGYLPQEVHSFLLKLTQQVDYLSGEAQKVTSVADIEEASGESTQDATSAPSETFTGGEDNPLDSGTEKDQDTSPVSLVPSSEPATDTSKAAQDQGNSEQAVPYDWPSNAA